MKKEDLKALGLTDEQIDKIHALNGIDVNAEKAKTDKALEDMEKFKTQLSETQETLKKFDGVDVEAYKTQIAELNNKLETQTNEYTKEKEDREYSEWLTNGLGSTKVKSIKALQAELGDKLNPLRDSKNRDEDLKKILEENKGIYEWMIPSEEPLGSAVKNLGDRKPGAAGADNTLRIAMGLKPVE